VNPTQSSRPIRVLRYKMRCLNGHETTYDTPEWPGLIPVHCQAEGCGWQMPTSVLGEPEVIQQDAFGREVCPYCLDLKVSDSEGWQFCCSAQEDDARREWMLRHPNV
jgi:hypothetical protein